MVGENFGIYSSQFAKNALKLSTMVGEIFEINSRYTYNINICDTNIRVGII